MSAISTWVISICGVSILSVLVDLFLPDGQTNKHIKNVFSFAILLVMIAPLPNLIKSAPSISSMISDFNYTIQTEYIYGVNRSKVEKLCDEIENELAEKGIMNTQVEISADTYDFNLRIDGVFVNLEQMILSDNVKKDDVYDAVYDCVCKKINIKKEKVMIDE